MDVTKQKVGNYTIWKCGEWRVVRMEDTNDPYILSSSEMSHLNFSMFLRRDTPELAILAILQQISGMEFYMQKGFTRWPR